MATLTELFDVAGYGVVVTGGASGLGLAFAENVRAQRRARVTLLDVHRQRLDGELERLIGDGLDVRGEQVDVTDHVALDRAIDEAADLYGRLDAVFANAGIDPGPGFLASWTGDAKGRNPDGLLEHYTDERWNQVVDINLNAVFATVRAAARHMKRQGHGSIVLTTSVAATRNEPAIGAAYMATKAACRHLTASVAHEMAAHGVTVNAIAPGLFPTNIGGGHTLRPEMQAAMSKLIPMHRVGAMEDMAGLALFLVSPASRYITGQEIQIDGGWSIGTAD